MRRMFWMTVGAAAGVSGYRKMTKLGPVRGARAIAAFVRDVGEGMRIYRFSVRRGQPTLERHRDTQDWAFTRAITDGECSDEVKDGR